jgi:hypothetical protein
MKRFAIVFGLITLFAGVAGAGLKGINPLVIDTKSFFARGGLGDVRQDPVLSLLGCSVYATKGGIPALECSAVQGNTWVWCYSVDPALISVVQGANSDAFLYFEWDANYECQYISVSNGSHLLPKTP